MMALFSGLFATPTLPKGYVIAHLYDNDDEWYQVMRRQADPETGKTVYYWLEDARSDGSIGTAIYASEDAAIKAACTFAAEQTARDRMTAAKRRAQAEDRMREQMTEREPAPAPQPARK